MEGFPWFPFYTEQFLGSRKVKLMSDANVGRYVKLLAEEWEHGPLPADLDRIGRLLGMDGNAIANAWAELSECFTLTDAGWVNERLEEIRDEQLSKRKRRQKAGKKGAEARWSQEDIGTANGNANSKAIPDVEVEVEKEKKETKQERIDREFEEEFWPRYPVRKGNRAKKEALHAWRGRMRDGVDPGEIVEAVKRYHRYCEVEESIGTPYVMQARTFLNDPDNFNNPWTPPTKEEKPAPKRAPPPPPDSTAANVRNEKPQQSGTRQTQGLEHVSGKPEEPDRSEEADRWLEQHKDEADEMLREVQTDMEWALANTRNPEVQRGMVRAALRRKALERIDHQEAA